MEILPRIHGIPLPDDRPAPFPHPHHHHLVIVCICKNVIKTKMVTQKHKKKVLRDRCGYFAELYRSNFIFTSFSQDSDCYFRPFLVHNNNRFLALFKFIFTLFSSLTFNILHFLFLPVWLGRV